MTLTEEQRGTVGFDLEAARAGIAHYRIENPSNVDTESHLKDLVDQANLAEDALAEIERLRANVIAANHSELDLQLRIKELEADLEQSEICIQARLDVIDQQAARIQELGGMLSIRTEELEIAHSCARSEREMHEKELVVFARKIAELEDALVEGLTNFLHYRASCYDPARRCPYAKECDDCSTWDACGHVEKFRSEARRQLQAEGKIGPDAKPRVWQIEEALP